MLKRPPSVHNASPIPIEGQLIDINLQKRGWNNCSLFPSDSSGTAGEEEEEEEEHQKVSLLHSRQYMGILCSVTSTTLSVLECRREPMRLFWSVRDPKIVMWMVNEQNVYLYKAVDYSPFCTGLLRFFSPTIYWRVSHSLHWNMQRQKSPTWWQCPVFKVLSMTLNKWCKPYLL